ncbi:tRNA (adenosine(37)-N6)-threonylcarbamoyltransferase complex dimerization subunit type 1 TsaB [uncultured Maritimibacter sp.]|uniref:tRNA (adenosine(37)-N6)-threonylcarbamoyltransferase complex dimerization subunit type 1 TsaB n=2 Tax=Maritimibacter TaxID=404235 RepID=UPI000C0A63AD|nr:tRNA (adenosine(37)-N6)-threonylcarbamoyltransferase complex dimerization subunit type 1 TsaB [Maritimibacter sp.]
MGSDPTLLAFDTSAAHCAAALLSGGRIVDTRVEEMGRGQAERLMPLLEEVLADAGLGWRDLDAVAVGVGPGNFTGIRISVAAARGLALGLARPAVGVSTLEAQAFGQALPVRAVADARRGMVYVQTFGDGGDAPRIVDAGEVGTDLPVAGALPPAELVQTIGRIAQGRLAQGGTINRPAPLYIRSADAAPASDQPPVILP